MYIVSCVGPQPDRLLILLPDDGKLKKRCEGCVESMALRSAWWARCPGERGAQHQWSSLLLFLSAAGSSGRREWSLHTTQFYSWSGCSPSCLGWRSIRWGLPSCRRSRRPVKFSWPHDAILMFQERSSMMCTPRNLVLLTVPTAGQLMVSGGCWVCALKKSTTFSFEEIGAVFCCQSWFSRVKRRGLSTYALGTPSFNEMVLGVLLPNPTDCCLPVS